MYCKKCGSQIDDNSEFCSSCGSNVGETTQSSPKNDKSKDKLTILGLVFSILSLICPLGLILNKLSPSGGIDEFLTVVGIIFLIPAVGISSIATLRAVSEYKKTGTKSKAFTTRIAASCMSVAFPLVVFLVLMIFQNPIDYLTATKLLEKGEYEEAQNIFWGLNDYKDSKEMVKESKYRKAIEDADVYPATALRAFEELAIYDYKESRALHLYMDAHFSVDSMVESFKDRLKDPSSYKEISKSVTYRVVDDNFDGYRLDILLEITYSATNSFGARVSDTYTEEDFVILSEVYDFTTEEVEDILKKSISEIVR